MGDINQFNFVKKNTSSFKEPFLEVGSRDYGTTADLRSLFPEQLYVGVDLSQGKGVDYVLDLTRPFSEIDKVLGGQRFNTIFCLSVLEHCADPFKMADNLTRLLAPGGMIYVSVPFAWKFHAYPSDYWRFTHEGVKQLFPGLNFSSLTGCTTSSSHVEERPLDKDIGLIRMSGRWHRNNGHYFRGISADILRLLSKFGLLRWLIGFRYVLAPTMINMIGVRDKESISQVD